LILIYVQHLLGSGHLQRIRLISEELFHQGKAVTIVSGGMPGKILDIPGIDVVQLEPIRSEGIDFSQLVNDEGIAVDDSIFERRRDQLLELYKQLAPKVVLIESFPFGRRAFRLELIALLKLAEKNRPDVFVACSIRDVLQSRKLKRELESCEIIKQYFDAVLVHGDKSFISLQQSFVSTVEIETFLHYTGYVAAAPVPRPLDHITATGDIIVSAGGGAAGQQIYQTAIEAAALARTDHQWRILVGSGISGSIFEDFCSMATANVIVERNRADYRDFLASCSLCICQAGYNSVLDILVTAAPALLIPFEGAGETEQLMRSEHMAGLKRIRQLREKDLTAEQLLEEVEKSFSDDPVDLPEIDLCGAQNSADFLISQLQQIPA
jgi:predicted glycosyltransferase